VPFDLQGHRGARGLRPENTLPSFEAAFEAGVTTVETDLHLTRDGVPVLCHDPVVTATLFRPAPPLPLAVAALTLTELRQFQADRNPSQVRFPAQDPTATPVALRFASERGMDPHAVPTVRDLFDFAAAYAGPLGERVGVSDGRRQKAAAVRFDLELKRVPFYPETIGDGFDGRVPGQLEAVVAETLRAAGMAARTTVRSFDHRSVLLFKQLLPEVTGALLMAETAPLDPAGLARQVGAELYCPSYQFLDADLIGRAHAEGIRVVPWTVNVPDQWRRLIDWGVDGITTDFPDQLAADLRKWGVEF
jgi:glycerophosphoryl diester phosphodiesterase